MKKLASRLRPVPLFMAVWIVLNEEISWQQILTGLVFSLIALAVTNVMLLKGDYASAFRISPLILLRTFITVIAQVYVSGIRTIPHIWRGRGEVAIDAYTSTLDQDLTLAMLATAVTLTPGTVTVSLSERTLQILHFQDRHEKSGSDTGHDDWKPVEIEAILTGKRP